MYKLPRVYNYQTFVFSSIGARGRRHTVFFYAIFAVFMKYHHVNKMWSQVC